MSFLQRGLHDRKYCTAKHIVVKVFNFYLVYVYKLCNNIWWSLKIGGRIQCTFFYLYSFLPLATTSISSQQLFRELNLIFAIILWHFLKSVQCGFQFLNSFILNFRLKLCTDYKLLTIYSNILTKDQPDTNKY